MRLMSTLSLLAAAVPFVGGGVSITVNVSVDSNVASVAVKAGNQSMSASANESATWAAWTVDTDYVPTLAGVTEGYTGKWRVTADGLSTLSGGNGDAINLSQSYAGCSLSFYGEPNTYKVTLNRQGGSGDSSVTATYNEAMPAITPLTRTGYGFGGYTNSTGVTYYNADGTSARPWDKTSDATLYAQWRPAANNVTFDRRLGTGGTRSVVATYGEAMPPITLPVRTGYAFDAYTALPDGGTKYYNADGSSARTWNMTEATTLYARWKAVKPTVVLDAQGGSGGSSYVNPIYGCPMPTANMPHHTGWTFRGFTSQADGSGTRYYNAKGASARKWDCTSNTTLYAQWTVNEYSVALDPQGGGGGTPSVTAIYGVAMPMAEMPTRTGYEFRSYAALPDGGTKYYNADGTSAHDWNVAENATLYAQWKPLTYTVTFDRQSGSGGTSSDKAIFNADMPAITPPTRTGYEFCAYTNAQGVSYYNADGKGTTNWTVASSATLYAQWKPLTYTVTFDRSPGSGGTANTTATYDAPMPSVNPPARAGYDFSSYTNAQGVSYYNHYGVSVTNWNIAANTTLYAEWKPCAYTVTLDPQPGAGGAESVTATYAAAMPKVEKTPTRTGYDFSSYTNSTGTTYYDRNGSSATNWNIAADTTLYAEWKPRTYTITFNRQFGSGGTSSVTATYDAAMPTAEMPTRTGYEFCSYTNATGTTYYNSDGTSATNWNIAANTTLYAEWKPSTYEITFDLQSGSGGTASATATYDAAMPMAEMPERTGYDFGGYTNAIGTTYYDHTGASARNWDLASDTPLYAKWKPCTYTVTLDPQGGSNGTVSVSATYDAAMLPIKLPTRTGYVFCSYTTEPNGGGTTYYDHNGKSAANWNIAADTTLYAYWTGRVYTVTLNPQGGSNGTESVTATYDAAMPNAKMPTRTGYDFSSYTNSTGTTYYNADGTSATNWNIAADTTLYAKWKPCTYKVTLDPQGGSNGTASVSATYDAAMPTNGVAMPTRTGYVFCSYTTEPNGGGTTYYDHNGKSAANWNIAADTTLYAYWTGRVYTVTLNPQGGSNGTESVTATYDAAMPNAEMPTRTGYEFSSYTNSTGTTYYNSDGTSATNWNIASNTTFYAEWKPRTYTVTLDPQGGSNGTASVTATYDAAMPTNGVTMPTRDGYEFCSYTNSTGTAYYDHNGQSATNWNIAANTTLYAYWTGRVYAVTLDARDPYGRGDGVLMTNGVGAAVSFTNRYVTVGEQWDLPYDPETFTNQTSTLAFAGWSYTNSAGEVTTLDLPSLVPPQSAGITNLIAQWYNPLVEALDEPKLLFNTFGRSSVDGSKWEEHSAKWSVCRDFEYPGTNVVQSVVLPTSGDPNRIYIAWLTTELEGTGKLTFQWKCDAASGNTFKFVPDGLTWSSDKNKLFNEGESYMVPVVGRSGWYQVEYNKTSDGVQTNAWAFALEGTNDGGTGYVDCVTWTPKTFTYTIVFNANADGVEGDMDPMVCTYSVETNLTECAFKRTGYTFSGWAINSVDDACYMDKESVKELAFEGEVNLYAQWSPNTYKVTFKPNAADVTGTMPSLLCTYDVPANLTPCAFERTGYGFAGWTTNGADGVVFADGAPVSNLTTNDTVEMFACWTGVTYAVTLDVRDPEGRGDGVLTNDVGEAVNVVTNFYTVGEPWDLPIPTNTNQELTFAGWSYTNSENVVTNLDLPSLVPPPSAGTTNLVAKWSDSLSDALDAPTLTFETSGESGDGLSWEEDSAKWSVCRDFEYPGTNVVQSVGLPPSGNSTTIYIAWLKTALTGAGKLTFQWKCDAHDNNAFYFVPDGGTWSSDKKMLFEESESYMVEVDGRPGWYQVEYTKTSTDTQTFAWAFALEGINGGGTGYVDRVTWAPSE